MESELVAARVNEQVHGWLEEQAEEEETTIKRMSRISPPSPIRHDRDDGGTALPAGRRQHPRQPAVDGVGIDL
jgi:hypothetical protein